VSLVLAYVVAGVIGGLVGAVEIFQRYRAEPFPAVLNRWGAAYLLFNAGMALAAFWVATAARSLTETTAALELVQWAALAGFGSSAVIRAKLLDIKLGDGKELALGPEIVVQTFLAVLDRELDRYRGQRRFDTVRRLLAGVDFERAKLRLPLQVFQAMQAVTEEETEKLMKRVAEVDELATLSSQDKAYLLGFYLLDLVGEEFLAGILDKHKDDFQVVAPAVGPAGVPGDPPPEP
jgi:hypothetical protein